jgi:hypothetical protein
MRSTDLCVSVRTPGLAGRDGIDAYIDRIRYPMFGYVYLYVHKNVGCDACMDQSM